MDDIADLVEEFPAPPAPQRGPMFTYSTPDMPWFKRSLIRTVERLSGRARFERLYRHWQKTRDPDAPVFSEAVRVLGFDPQVASEELEHIPASGPLLIVANHPFGIADGLTIGHLVARVRPDVKLICHSLLCQPREARVVLMPIDFGAGQEARRTSDETRRQAVDWLDAGHALIIFPAGGVATSVTPFGKRAADFLWHPFVARLARRAGVKTVAIYVEGRNSRAFHLASHVSYALRVALIFHETRRRLNTAIRFRIAAPVDCAAMEKGDVVAWLRARTYAMAEPGGPVAAEEFTFPSRVQG